MDPRSQDMGEKKIIDRARVLRTRRASVRGAGESRSHTLTLARRGCGYARLGIGLGCCATASLFADQCQCARPSGTIGAGNMCLDASTVSKELHVAP